MCWSHGSIDSDGVKESRENHSLGCHCDSVLLVKAGRHQSHVVFYLPDGFASSTLLSEKVDVVRVALWVISRDEVDEGGFTAAIWAADFPMLARHDFPI